MALAIDAIHVSKFHHPMIQKGICRWMACLCYANDPAQIEIKTLDQTISFGFNLSRFLKENRAKLDLVCFLPRAIALGYQKVAPLALINNFYKKDLRPICIFWVPMD